MQLVSGQHSETPGTQTLTTAVRTRERSSCASQHRVTLAEFYSNPQDLSLSFSCLGTKLGEKVSF